MPSTYLSQLPKSRSAEEFELICSDILQNKYGVRFQSYGRNGQAQNGIDLFAPLPGVHNLYVVAQCKNYFGETKPSVLIKKMQADINAAEQQTNMCIQKFYLMTSYNCDVQIQNFILTCQNLSFQIELWFWEEIQGVILSNQNMLEKYYSSYLECGNIVALFNLAFIGTQFSNLIFLLLGDRGETNRFCELLQDGETWIKNQSARKRFSEFLQAVYQFVNGDLPWEILLQSHKNSNEYFWCCEIEKIVSTVGDNLPPKQRILFLIGSCLGYYSKKLDENDQLTISEAAKDSFMELCQTWGFTNEQNQKIESLFEPMILPAPESLTEKFAYDSQKATAPSRVYDYIRELLMRS